MHAFVIIIIFKARFNVTNFNYIYLWKKEKPNQNNINGILKTFMACSVIIHKHYLYGFKNFKFYNDEVICYKQFKIGVFEPFSKCHGSVKTL
jgi:hypothetical protein